MIKRKFRKPGIYTKDKGKLVIHQFRSANNKEWEDLCANKREIKYKKEGDKKYLIFGLQKRAHTVGKEEERKEEEKRRRRRRRRRGQDKV